MRKKDKDDKGQEIEIMAPVIQTVTTKFNLPMLTIIPINSLAVDTVDIGFEMEVKSSFSESEKPRQKRKRKVKHQLIQSWVGVLFPFLSRIGQLFI